MENARFLPQIGHPDRHGVSASDNDAVIGLEGDVVVYREQATEVWRVSLLSVAIVGEYTTANGPYVDDYFFVFVTKPQGHHFHASYYAKGCEALLAALEDRLGAKIRCSLVKSTKLTSRCMWPPQLAGHALFRFTRIPSGGGWNRVRRMLSGRCAFDFTIEVERYLASVTENNVQPNATPNADPDNPCPAKPRAKRASEIQDSIRRVLFRDWDPIGVNSNPNLKDEYDAYIAPIYRILVGNRSEDDLIGCLQEMERDRFGLEPGTSEQLRNVARKLLTLDVRM